MSLTNRPVFQKGLKKPKTPCKSEREHPAYAYGTDAEYLDFVCRQPSWIDGSWNQRNPDRNISCHFNEVGKFGRGFKQKYSALPMTHPQHDIQTRFGYEALRPMAEWIAARDEMVERFIAHMRARKGL